MSTSPPIPTTGVPRLDVAMQDASFAYTAGDGRDTDTEAFQARIDAASTKAGGSLYIPPGTYTIKQTLRVPTGVLEIVGCGSTSNLQWAFDGPLFEWGGRCLGGRFADFKITALGSIAPQHAAFDLSHGASDVSFERLEIRMARPEVVVGQRVLLQRWGTGIRIRAAGQLVRPSDGGSRVFRDWLPGPARTVQRRENRELFASGALCDGSLRGLVISDKTFVTLTGCWLASCDEANLLVTDGADPTLELTGGIVFNAGTWIKPKSRPYRSHGAQIFGGSVAMSGTMVKNNAGVGLSIGPKVTAFTVTGCAFVDNWANGVELAGICGTFTGNVLRGNGGNQLTVSGGSLAQAGNQACSPIQR